MRKKTLLKLSIAMGIILSTTLSSSVRVSATTESSIILKEENKIVWENGRYSKFKDITKTPDGGYLIVANDKNSLIKCNSNFEEEWSKIIEEGDYIAEFIVKLNDGNYIIIWNHDVANNGIIENANVVISKYAENGDLIWKNNLSGNGNDKVTGIKPTSDGGFIVVGDSSSTDLGFTNNGDDDAVIIKYDKDGNRQWVKNKGGISDDTFRSVIETKSGYFLAIGTKLTEDSLEDDIIIVKYDKNGNEINSTTIAGNEFDEGMDVVETNDGFIGIGNTASTNLGFENPVPATGMVFKFNEDLEISKIKGFSSPTTMVLFNNLSLSSNGYLVIDGYESIGSVDISIYILDNNLNEKSKELFSIKTTGIGTSIICENDNTFTLISNNRFLVKYKIIEPQKPTINKLPNNKIELIDNNPVEEKDRLYYRINYNSLSENGSWVEYTEPFEVVYDDNGNFNLEVKSVNIYSKESDLTTYNKTINSDQILILFNQPETLEFSLSTNSIDFGEVDGIVDTELQECVTATISSSLPFTINGKGEDFIGINENEIIPISKLQVKVGSEEYKNLANSNTSLLTDTSGVDKTYPISLNLQATKGYLLDRYTTNLTFTVTQN